MDLIVLLHIISEVGCGHWSCRNTGILNGSGKFGETRRTSVSGADTEDCGIGILLYLLPQDRIISEGIASFAAEDRLYLRMVPHEPVLHLFHELPGPCKTCIYQVDGLAF